MVVHRHEIKTPDIIKILDQIDGPKIRFSFKTNAFANGFSRRSILKRFVSREEK